MGLVVEGNLSAEVSRKALIKGWMKVSVVQL